MNGFCTCHLNQESFWTERKTLDALIKERWGSWLLSTMSCTWENTAALQQLTAQISTALGGRKSHQGPKLFPMPLLFESPPLPQSSPCPPPTPPSPPPSPPSPPPRRRSPRCSRHSHSWSTPCAQARKQILRSCLRISEKNYGTILNAFLSHCSHQNQQVI